MGTIQIKRGLSTNLPSSAALGEILYTTDTKRFYIGNGSDAQLTEYGNLTEVLAIINTKSGTDHKHTSIDITDFDNAVDERIANQRGVANGVASLDENGKVPTNQIPSVFKEAEVFADISERNTLTPFTGLHAFVLDATDDSTVEAGGAEYIYDGTKWVKVSELNDLDAIITWDNVTNKPDLVTTILDLTDTPTSFTNQAGKVLLVNSEETGLEFSNIYTGDVDGGSF